MIKFKETWSNLKPPSKGYSISKITGTNALAAIDSDSRPLLFIHGVTDPLPKRNFRHLDIQEIPMMILTVNEEKREVRRILRLEGDETIDVDLFATVLEYLGEIQPDGNFTAKNLIKVLDLVKEMVRGPKRPPTREEVKGAWGEVYLLNTLIKNSKSASTQKSILSSWEGDEHQENIDFRFNHVGIVAEVKTTESEQRNHIIHGMAQLEIPSDYNFGVLASLTIQEIDEGETVKEMINQIIENLCGSDIEKKEAIEILNHRCRIRGAASVDERYRFSLAYDGLFFYKLEDVPRPKDTSDVIPMEWMSNLSNTTPISPEKTLEIMMEITKSNFHN